MLDVPGGKDLSDSSQPRAHQLTQLVARHVADVHVPLNTSNLDALLLRLRSRTYEAHLPEEDVPELRQLVHACAPKEPAGPRNPRIVPSSLDFYMGRALQHRPELQDSKESSIPTDARLSEKDRTTIPMADRRDDENP